MSRPEPGPRLTDASLRRLLERLHPEAEQAGRIYQHLREALIAFFNWRGVREAEECADESLDRLASRLHHGAAIEDVPRFARGIARLVLLEHWRRPEVQAKRVAESRLEHVPAPAPAEPEPLHECLERCLQELPEQGRALILEYYLSAGQARIANRQRLASELGVSESALRNRAQRLRDRLERCILHCAGPADTAARAGAPESVRA
jgi:DNA-directed RNA polymerase specialized sigma24 family protein